MNNQVAPLFVGLFLVTIAAAMAVWKFSDSLNLDFTTGSKVLLGVAVVLGITVYSMLTGWFSIIAIGVLPALWLVCLPAIDYWATSDYSSFRFGQYDEYPWWAEWYSKASIFFGLIGLGFLIKKLRSPY